MTITNHGRRLRRWWKVLAVALLVLVAAIAALPPALGTAPARRWLLSRANKALAPARLEVAAFRFSWFGPTRLTGFAIRDAEGEPVIAAPVANWDRNLRQILFERPRYGTLDLSRAKLDVERRADGSIDLYEAIKPVISKNPRNDLHIRFRHAQLRFRTAGQPVPIQTDRADLTLDIPAAPRPLTWTLTLENPGVARPAALEIGGRFERWQSPPTLAVDLKAQRWPWAFSVPGLDSAGQLDGQLALKGAMGNWSVSGDAKLLDLNMDGPRLAGDHLRLDKVTGSWNLTETSGTWDVHRLDLVSPLGSVKASGQRPRAATALARIEGTLDLAALADHLPHLLRLREGITLERGSAQVRIESSDHPKPQGQGQRWDVEAKVSDLEAQDHGRRFTLHEPATLTGRLSRGERGIALERMAVRSAFLNATGQGDADRGIDWSGSLDLAGLQRQLRDLVDFGAVELAGQGNLTGHYRRTGTRFEGGLTSELRGLRIAGLGMRPVQRDLVQLELALDGDARPSGLPGTWNMVRLDMTSGETTVRLTTKSGDDANAVTLKAQAPIPWADPPRRARGQLDAQWGKAGVVIDRLSLALVLEDAPPGDERILLNTKGRYDRAAGALVLTPVSPAPGSTPGRDAIAIGPEGIQVSGLGGAGTVRASVGFTGDLGSLRRLAAPGDLSSQGGLGGPWSARATAESTEDGLRFVGKVAAHPTMTSGESGQVVRDEGPIALSLNLLRPTGSDHLEVAEIALASRYATIEGSGRLNEPGGARVADLRGTLTPRWDAINTLLSDRVEPGARVSGKPRSWRVSGPLAGTSAAELLKTIDAEFGLELAAADIYGLHVGPIPLVVRAREGRVAIDVIDTTLNGGRIHLEPELTLDRERGSRIHLDQSSSISNAEINDEVSRRFLSYVAPVLDRATRAHGRVSVALKEAEFPIGGPEKRDAKVEGEVVFQEVEFLPGPFVDQLYDLLGRTDRPSVKLDEPVALTIADRRVYQNGLALPLGNLTRVELDGWVDFDRNIELTASLPITAAMVGNAPVLSAIVENQRINVPIRGTLKHPEIDRDAMNLSLKNLGQSVLTNGAVRGAAELFLRLKRPRDPNAPPPPTFQERRANRAEKRAERRRQQGLEP